MDHQSRCLFSSNRNKVVIASLGRQRRRRHHSIGLKTRVSWRHHLWAVARRQRMDYLTQSQKSSARASWQRGSNNPRPRKRREETQLSLTPHIKMSNLQAVISKIMGVRIQPVRVILNHPRGKWRDQRAELLKLEWMASQVKYFSTRSISMKPWVKLNNCRMMMKQLWTTKRWPTMIFKVQSRSWASMIGWSSL